MAKHDPLGAANMEAEKQHAEDSDFKMCFEALQRSGENFRSTIYAFVLIYGGLLMWSLNAYVYPAQQNRIAPLEATAVELIRCLRLQDQGKPETEQCRQRLEHSVYHKLAIDPTIRINDDSARGIDLELAKKQIELQQERAANIAEFHVPLVGIMSDRSWIWLVTCVLGLFFFQIIKDQLINLFRLLEFLKSQTGESQARRILLSTTQVITSSGIALRYSHTKFPIIAVILFMPIVATLVLLWDWIYFIRQAIRGTGTGFLSEPEFFGGFLAVIILFIEALLYRDILVLLRRLFDLNADVTDPGQGK